MDAIAVSIFNTTIQKRQASRVGLDTLSAALCDSANTIEEVIEPYLIQQTPRGRILTNKGKKYV
jgi:Holliday junction DNA helicase RuvB